MSDKRTIVVALAGAFGSGKSTVAAHLADEYGFVWLRTRDAIAALLTAQGKLVTEQTLRDMGHELAESGREEEMYSSMLQEYDAQKNYVIDSLRHEDDLLYFQQRFGDRFRLLFLELPDDERAHRYVARDDGRSSAGDFTERAAHPVELGVPQLRKHADAVVITRDRRVMLAQVNALVSTWVRDTSKGTTLSEMLNAVRRFHEKNGFDIGTRNRTLMHYLVGLLVEELGELHQCLSKGKGDLAEEHADMLILLLGNCLVMGIDLESAFWAKIETIMLRPGRRIDGILRVSSWTDVTGE